MFSLKRSLLKFSIIVVFYTNAQICMLEKKKEDTVPKYKAVLPVSNTRGIMVCASCGANLHQLLSELRNLYAIVFLMDTFDMLKGLQYCY